jgi:Domain of unknown function (DUF4836)
MIRKALLLPLAFFFCINATLFSQNLLQHIPEDATFVTTFNPSALNAKIPFSKLKEFDFFKMGMEEMPKSMDPSDKEEMLKLLSDPSNFGMDLMASSYIFGKVTAEGNAFSFMFKLSDVAKFTEFFKNKLPPGIEVMSTDGFSMIAPEQDMAFAWTDQFALITGVEVHRKYDFDVYEYKEEPYYEEEEIIMEDMEIIEEEPILEETENIEDEKVVEEEVVVEEIVEDQTDYAYEENAVDEHAEKERKFTADWVKKVMNCNESASVMTNPKFMLANSKKTDANLWLDYLSFYNTYVESMGDYAGDEAAMLAEMMGAMYEGTYLSIGLNFDAGAVNFNMDSYTNAKMLKFYRESTDAKFNKKFHKYVPSENLMGYWSFNINVENTVEGYKDLFRPMLNSIPMYGSMANDAIDIMDIFIDEEAIYDLWKGDAFFAVTGLKDFEKTITTYEYDDEFNKTETQKTVTQKLPEFIMMSSYGNEENVRKFLDLGTKTPFFENKGSYYQASIPETGMDLYVALNKGILFFTNNSDLIHNRLDSGYPKKERMSKAQCKQLKENSMVLYWDIPQSLNAATAFGVPLMGPQGKILNVSKDSFESFVWTAPKGGENSINQKISLNFVNKEMNSMEQIFNYINEVVVMMMGGTSM